MEHKNWMGFAGESWKEHIDEMIEKLEKSF